MDLKKLTKILKNFEAIAVVYDARDLEWYIQDEDYSKEPSYDMAGRESKEFYDIQMEVKKVYIDDLEEGEDLLNELATLKTGDTVQVKSLVLEESPGKYFNHGEEENLKIKKIEIKRESNNLYSVTLTIDPIFIEYGSGNYAEDSADYKYQEWKDRRDER